MRTIKKVIPVEVTYYVGRQDPNRGVFQGGVPDPPFLEEIVIDLSPDEVYDEATDSFQPTGKTQLNLRGTNRAYAALAQYLLALCELETRDPDYHAHFEEIRDSDNDIVVHLIIHAPHR